MTDDQPTNNQSDSTIPSSTIETPSSTTLPMQSTTAETVMNSTTSSDSPAYGSPAMSTASPVTLDNTDTSQSGIKRESPDSKQAIVPPPLKKANYSKDAVGPRAFLDSTVTPTLLEGMKLLVQERPEDPLAYLANFLWSRSNEGKKSTAE